MAKVFRNVSQLPDDFLQFNFTAKHPFNPPVAFKELEQVHGKEMADKLNNVVSHCSFTVNSNMVGCKKAVEQAAMDRLKENCKEYGLDPASITVEASNPHWITFCKDGVEFASGYGMMAVNDKYMDRKHPEGEIYPIIPTKDLYEDLGCSWIEYRDPNWEDFERVEKALEQNRLINEVQAVKEAQKPGNLKVTLSSDLQEFANNEKIFDNMTLYDFKEKVIKEVKTTMLNGDRLGRGMFEVIPAEGMMLDIYDGKHKLGQVHVDCNINLFAFPDGLPNGDLVQNTGKYDWNDFDRLGEDIHEKGIVKTIVRPHYNDSAENVECISIELGDNTKIYMELGNLRLHHELRIGENGLQEGLCTYIPDEMAMSVVQHYPKALFFVEKQTSDMCMVAMQLDGYALGCVRKQTPEICMAAVKQNGLAIRLVKDQTPEICEAALKQNPDASKWIRDDDFTRSVESILVPDDGLKQ